MSDCLASICFSDWLEEKVNDVKTSSGHSVVLWRCGVAAISSIGEEKEYKSMRRAAKPKKL